MHTKWLFGLIAIGVVAVSMVVIMVTNAIADGETLMIEYDVVNRKVISVKDKKTGREAKQYDLINGIPVPLTKSTITRVDSITILSDVQSPGCSCYGGKCIGDTCP